MNEELLFHCDDHEKFDPECHRCFLAEYGEIDDE